MYQVGLRVNDTPKLEPELDMHDGVSLGRPRLEYYIYYDPRARNWASVRRIGHYYSVKLTLIKIYTRYCPK